MHLRVFFPDSWYGCSVAETSLIISICDSLGEVGDTVSKLLFNYVFFFPRKIQVPICTPRTVLKQRLQKPNRDPKKWERRKMLFSEISRENVFLIATMGATSASLTLRWAG